MNVQRTPEERFANLPDYPFAPHYLDVGNLRMHYLDESPSGRNLVLLLHGEPSWSYLYRKMIPGLVAAGHRVVAPDLIGFGKSDKPSDPAAYTYAAHMSWLEAFLAGLDLRNVTLFCQDWGGLLGLRALAENPGRFARVIAANTFLPTGDQDPGDAFRKWQHFAMNVSRLDVGRVVKNGCVSKLSPEVVAAYNAPFPDETYKMGARRFPSLVPTTPDDPAAEANRAAWEKLRKWDRPFLTAFSDSDPITQGAHVFFRRAIPGARGQPHTIVRGGGHFLQEDCGERLAEITNAFIANS